ncbi:HU family DNA-binding protein [Enemella sp. A6]|uniref:HU family DNA-binding protein n=1 Tax=Enemella sp. A6 TaxID=3440152 RepID=UPI003EBB155E
MNKAEFVNELAKHFEGNKARAARVLDVVLDEIMTQTAEHGHVGIARFGVFEVIDRPERVVRNPRTGERKQVPAVKVPRFRPGSAFNELVDSTTR